MCAGSRSLQHSVTLYTSHPHVLHMHLLSLHNCVLVYVPMYIRTYVCKYTLVQGAGHYSTAHAVLALLLKGLCVCVLYITVK